MKHSLAVLASVLLASCGSGGEPTPKPSPSPWPKGQFQKMIYDNGTFAVLRDRGTGCQMLALLRGETDIVDITPRTRLMPSGKVEQICAREGDPMSMPIKVEGTSSLFRRTHVNRLTLDASIDTYRDIETGCEWLVLESWSTVDITRKLRPRMGLTEDGVQQVCRPVAGESDEADPR